MDNPNTNLTESEILNKILEHAPSVDYVDVDLPSRNKFYTIPSGKKVQIRPLTFEDEKALVSTENASADAMNLMLSRCVANLDVNELLQIDKLYLLMKMRELSYGKDYLVDIVCSKCNKENHLTIQLDKFPVRYMEDDFTNPIEVFLPEIKKTIKLQMPRVRDQPYISNSEQLLSNLWRFVTEVDGYDSKPIIAKVIPKLPPLDVRAILNAFNTTEYGLDTNVTFICKHCPNREDMELPLTAGFFMGS